jgi:hypothetical protein
MRVTRRRGSPRIALESVEVAVLNTLLDELDELIDGMDPTDASTRRLFPAGYRDDPDAESDFRELTEQTLREARTERYGLMRAVLPEGGGLIEVDAEDAHLWLTVLNDMRLALGTRLGVTEDRPLVASNDGPDAAAVAIYDWLTTLQDSLVHALMR